MPAGRESFFGTGYSNPDDDLAVLRRVRDALVPGARFLRPERAAPPTRRRRRARRRA
jgi:hypothetical protein